MIILHNYAVRELRNNMQNALVLERYFKTQITFFKCKYDLESCMRMYGITVIIINVAVKGYISQCKSNTNFSLGRAMIS